VNGRENLYFVSEGSTPVEPNAEFEPTPSNPTNTTEVTFDGSASNDPDGSIVEYRWDFDNDGVVDETTPTPTVTHTYTTPGSYTAALRVEDNDGLVSSPETRQITVSANTPPNAAFSFTPTNPNAGQSVSFDASASSDADGSIVEYRWNFGDGTTTTTPNPTTSHTYASGGTRTVSLTTVDGSGGSRTSTQQITVGSGGGGGGGTQASRVVYGNDGNAVNPGSGTTSALQFTLQNSGSNSVTLTDVRVTVPSGSDANRLREKNGGSGAFNREVFVSASTNGYVEAGDGNSVNALGSARAFNPDPVLNGGSTATVTLSEFLQGNQGNASPVNMNGQSATVRLTFSDSSTMEFVVTG
jgi:PKD repeat protein